MTARSSINPLPAQNFRRAIRENKKLMMVISILHLLGIPMGSLSIVMQLWTETLPLGHAYYYTDFSGYTVTAVICLGTALLLGIVAAVSVFQELWKKTKVDMLYSLPLNGTQRFFSHFLGGFTLYVLPYLIACVLGWIILISGGLVLNFEAMHITSAEYFDIVLHYYLIGSIGAFLLMLLYYTTTVIITVCCGTISETIYTTILLNCLVPGTLAAVIAVICDSVTGLDFAYLWYPIGYTSPAGGLIYLIFLITEFDASGYYHDLSISEAATHGMVPAFLRWALVMAVLIAAFLILAWQLYKKRRAESISKPFVYMAAYYIMLTLLTVLILTLILTGMGGGAIIFAAVVYLIMEIVRKRGFRRFWLSIVSFICTLAVVSGLFVAVNRTDAFGTVYRVPSLSTVSSVRVSFSDMRGPNVELEYTDKEIIREIQALHKDIVADIKEYGNTTENINRMMAEQDYDLLEYSYDLQYSGYHIISPEKLPEDKKAIYYQNGYYYNGEYIIEGEYSYAQRQHFEITYYTVTGSAINRTFWINPDQYMELLNIVHSTELYAKMYSDYFYHMLWNHLSEYRENGERYLQRAGELIVSHNHSERALHFLCDEELLERLKTAYYNDLLKIDPANTGGVYAYYRECTIWNNCTETIAILEEMGMEPFNASEKFGFADAEHPMVYDYIEYEPLNIRIYKPDQIRFASESGRGIAGDEVYIKPSADCYEDCYDTIRYTSMQTGYPELYKLLNAAIQEEITENCYMLVVNGEWWAVPEEHSALAEAVIAKGSGYAEISMTMLPELYYKYGSTQYN